MLNRERFSQRISVLCEAFGRDITRALLEAYWIALEELEESDFDRAVATCLKGSRFMPTPAEIRDAAGENLAVRADAAWREVRPLISKDGGTLSDPIAKLVVESLGGWRALGNRSEDENSTWTRKEFLRLYEAYASSPRAIDSAQRRLPRGGDWKLVGDAMAGIFEEPES